MSPVWRMCPRRATPAGEPGRCNAFIDTVMRRYGFEAVPVLWQIVIFVGRVFDGVGAWAAGGHGAVPTTTASPTWRMWPRKVCPAGEFGFVHARDEIVIRRHGFVAEPVR
jgi:hypothetical protein